jgi:hypothetical protein
LIDLYRRFERSLCGCGSIIKLFFKLLIHATKSLGDLSCPTDVFQSAFNRPVQWRTSCASPLLPRDASGLSDSVPPVKFVRQEPPELLGSGALHNDASRNEVLSHFLIGNDFVECLV